MNVSQRTVAIVLSEEGHEILQLAIPNFSDSRVALFYVQDTDEIGMWVRVDREDGVHLVMIRWEFVLAMDFPLGETKTVGMKPWRFGDARNYHVAMRRMQKPELHDNQEPEEAYRPSRDAEILQYVPKAHGAQGIEVAPRDFPS